MSDIEFVEPIIKNSKHIAILGCSNKPYRTSYQVAEYLLNHDYNIYPINPNHTTSLNYHCCNTMHDIPDEISIDIVDIFRNSKYTAEMVDQIVEWSEERNQKPVIWTQLGVSSEEAKQKADAHEFTYIKNRCLMADHRRLF